MSSDYYNLDSVPGGLFYDFRFNDLRELQFNVLEDLDVTILF